MKGTVLRWVVTVVAVAALVLGLVATIAGAASNTKSPTATSTECTQFRKRLAGAPATLRRVDTNLQELQALLPNVRLPARRAVVELRIQRLEQLRAELATRIADARTACGTAGSTT